MAAFTALYSLHWEYRQRWRVPVPGSGETAGFAYIEGRASGVVGGRFRGTNKARSRADGVFLTDAHGVIETDDGDTIVVALEGYGCPWPRGPEPIEDRTSVVLAVRHWTDSDRWASLNESISVGIGENRFTSEGVRLLYVEVSNVEWEPLGHEARARPQLPLDITIAPQPFDLDALRRARAGTAAGVGPAATGTGSQGRGT